MPVWGDPSTEAIYAKLVVSTETADQMKATKEHSKDLFLLWSPLANYLMYTDHVAHKRHSVHERPTRYTQQDLPVDRPA